MINPFQRLKLLQPNKFNERRSAYQRLYGLRENPFPSIAQFSPTVDDPRHNGQIYDKTFREEEEKRFFQLFVQPPTAQPPLSLGFIQMDRQAGGHGNGISSFLHHIKKRINEQEWEDWMSNPDEPSLFALAVHILPKPRQHRHFWQMSRLIFESLAEEKLFSAIDVQFRAALLLRLLNEQQIAFLAKRPADEVTAILQSQERFADLLKQHQLTLAAFCEEAERQLRSVSTTISESFLQHFVSAGSELKGLWKKWQKESMAVNSYQWRKNGIQWLIDGLIPIIILAGYQRFYLLLDEFEKIYIYQNARERDHFLDTLRQSFYERDSAAVRHQFITTVLTIHPSIYRYLNKHWRRVGLDNLAPLEASHMANISIELGPSTVEKLKHLLTTYLDSFRLDEDEDEHEDEHEDQARRGRPKGFLTLYPFADNALEPTLEAARFYPSDTLWFAHAILRKAATEEVSPPRATFNVEEFINSGVRPPRAEEDDLFRGD